MTFLFSRFDLYGGADGCIREGLNTVSSKLLCLFLLRVAAELPLSLPGEALEFATYISCSRITKSRYHQLISSQACEYALKGRLQLGYFRK